MQVHRVVHLDELHESVPMRVLLDGQAILLTKLDGEPHAITDLCPHNGSSLSEGVVRDGCVTCPAHLWRFSLHDGQRQGAPEIRVRVFPTRLTADGWVEVEVPAAPPVRSLRETLLAHAHGEDVNALS
jgi:nitrite reductase/ring-hydroxylating ferredoxin subunit